MVSKPIAGYSFQIQMDAPLSCYTPILQNQDKQKTLEERKKRKCVCVRARVREKLNGSQTLFLQFLYFNVTN